jgi:hypothetical protein
MGREREGTTHATGHPDHTAIHDRGKKGRRRGESGIAKICIEVDIERCICVSGVGRI